MDYHGQKSKWLKFVTAIAVAVAPLQSFAHDFKHGTVVIQSHPVETDSGPEIEVSIELIDQGMESSVLRRAIKHHPDATVTVFTPTEGSKYMVELDQQASSVDPAVQYIKIDQDKLEGEIQQFLKSSGEGAQKSSWYTRAKQKISDVNEKLLGNARVQRANNLAKGMLVTIVTASSFGASYYYFSGDLTTTAKLFGLAFVLNGFQIMATNLWQKYLRFGGTTVKKFHQMSAKVLGKTLETISAGKWGVKMQSYEPGHATLSLGRVLAAYGFNLSAATIITSLQNAEVSAVWLATLGLIGTWDAIWDLVFDRHIELGNMREQHLSKLIKYRLAIGPPVEAMAYSGGPFALAAAGVMGVVLGTGAIALFSAQHMQQAYERRRANLGDFDPDLTKWQKVKSMVTGKAPVESIKKCDEILSKEDQKSGDQSSFFPPSKTNTFWPFERGTLVGASFA